MELLPAGHHLLLCLVRLLLNFTGPSQSTSSLHGTPSSGAAEKLKTVLSLICEMNPVSPSLEHYKVLSDLEELHLGPNGDHPGLLFDRFYIPPPDTVHPFILSGSSLRDLVRHMDISRAHMVMLDATLTAAHRANNEFCQRGSNASLGVGQGMGSDPNHSGYRQAEWSSVGLSRQGCLICVVTYDHQISIMGQRGIRWIMLANLVPLWYKYTNDNKNLLNDYQKTFGNQKYHRFIANTLMLGVADVTWSPLHNDTIDGCPYSYLLMVTTSGHLVVWRVPYCDDTLEPKIFDVSKLENVTPKGKVTSLCYCEAQWKEGFIVVGTVQGDIHIYSASFLEDELGMAHTFSLPNVAIGMSTYHLTLNKLDKPDHFILYCAKNNIFFGFLLLMSPFDCCSLLATTHSITGCLTITGIKVLTPTLLYMSSKDGNFKEYVIDIDIDSPSLFISTRETIFTSDAAHYDGFCFSPNKAFLAVFETVAVGYDHLQLREPSIINIYQVNSEDTISTYLLSHTETSLSEHVDLFECLRLSFNRSSSCIPVIEESSVTSLNINEKRTYLWFTEILTTARETEENRIHKNAVVNTQTRLRDSILEDHISQTFSGITKENFPTNRTHRCSLFLMCKFLQKRHKDHPLLKNVLGHLETTGDNLEEKCVVCGSSVSFENVIAANCLKGHTMPRCLRTFLSTIPVLKCPHCLLFFCQDAKNWYSDGDRCLICLRVLKFKTVKRKVEEISEVSQKTFASPSQGVVTGTRKTAVKKGIKYFFS